MIHGDGVGRKFDVIISGRAFELESKARTVEELIQAHDDVLIFRDIIRACTHDEFNEWYELYSSTYKFRSSNGSKRKRRGNPKG